MPETDVWGTIARRIIPGIVNIEVARPYPYDAAEAGGGRATGFVVDKRLGLICTNAHVLPSAPLSARATFFERENFEFGAADVNLSTVYTDPVHDFAYTRYNTEDLKADGIEPVQLSFAQEVIAFQDICVMGNDAGQVISLLPGVLSRVNRNPPKIWDLYSDSMTHYLQGSADVSGGSSGSPVVNKKGDVVGMVAAGEFIRSTDYYLPVDKMRYVLSCLRAGDPVRRGTLQSTWLAKTRAECSAFGITRETLDKYSMGKTGLLSADQVLPEGPSHDKVQRGDILLEANNSKFETLTDFEGLLDRTVGETIQIRIWRHGKELEYDLPVQDLFKIAPMQMVEWSGNIFYDMPFLLAQYYRSPVKGVVMVDSKKRGVGRVMIVGIEHRQTPNLDAFIDVVQNLPDQKRILIEYHRIAENRTTYNKTITVSRSGFCREIILRYRQNDFSWATKRFKPLPLQTSTIPEARQITYAMTGEIGEGRFGIISSCMVGVEIRDTHCKRDATRVTRCGGLVVNNVDGMIVIPLQLCPSDLFEVSVIIENSVELPAEVIRSHPLGYMIIRCSLAQSSQAIGQIIFSEMALCIGRDIAIYGLEIDTLRGTVVETNVKDIGPVKVNINDAPLNVEVLHLENGPECGLGALIDVNGHLQGLWLPLDKMIMTYVGIPLSYLKKDFDVIQNRLPLLEPRRLHAELGLVSNHEARVFTDSHEAIVNFSGTKVVEVKRVTCENERQVLKARDLILKLDGKQVNQMSDLQAMFVEETLNLTIIRDKQILDCQVSTMSAGLKTHVVWALGAVCEPPPLQTLLVAQERYSEVFVHDTICGSPAQIFRLPSSHFVTKINGVATKNLDAFLEEVRMLPENEYCQISTVDDEGREYTTAIVPNEFFPCEEARRSQDKPNKWEFTRVHRR